MILDGPLFASIKEGAKRACWDIPRYRKSGRLTDSQLALGFLAFSHWYIGSLKAHAAGDDSQIRYPSDPARLAAIRVLAFAADQNDVCVELERTFKFEPTVELQWAIEKANNVIWAECLTRAIILACRSMAYSVATATGYNSTPVDTTEDGLALGSVVRDLRPDIVLIAASRWLDETFGKKLSEQMLVLE
jgi:hypothetical protein